MVQGLEAAGCTVDVSTLDVADPAQAAQLLADAGRRAPVGGVFHLAMVLEDRLIVKQARPVESAMSWTCTLLTFRVCAAGHGQSRSQAFAMHSQRMQGRLSALLTCGLLCLYASISADICVALCFRWKCAVPFADGRELEPLRAAQGDRRLAPARADQGPAQRRAVCALLVRRELGRPPGCALPVSGGRLVP